MGRVQALAFVLLVIIVAHDPLLGSMEKGAVPLSAPNPHTYIPGPPATKTGHRVPPSLGASKKASSQPAAAPNGYSVDSLLGSLEKDPVPPSAPNPDTNIPRPPATKTGQSAIVGNRVAPSLGSPKNATALPPAAPNGDAIAPSISTYP